MAESSLVVRRAESGPATLLLNRPGRANAIDESTVRALLTELDHDPWATILLGSTAPGIFCAGADLTISDAERARCSDLLYECYECLINRAGPVIAVVEGPAVGGGAQLTTAADLRIAGPGARWRWVGPGHGLAVGAWVLPDLLGRGAGLELALTGCWVDAPQAQRLGLITAVHEQPWQRAHDLVETIAGLDAQAVARVKEIATQSELSSRLAEERNRNRAAFTGALR